MGIWNILYSVLFCLYHFQECGGDVDSITGYFIGSQGLGLPEYIERITVNGVSIFYYDSTMNYPVPIPEWFNSTKGQQHWKDINLISQHNRITITTALQSATQQFNLTGSASNKNIYQGHGHCERSPTGVQKYFLTHAFNGKDFLSLDIDSKTYIASSPQALVYKRQREKNPVLIEITSTFYKNTCFERLNTFLVHAVEVLKKKVPKVSLFEKQKAGTAVMTCHVTGFFPREVHVEWLGANVRPWRDETIDVLPNEDGTFQTRRSVLKPEENADTHTYSCIVRHCSIMGNITMTWDAGTHTGTAVWISLVCFFLAVVAGFIIAYFCCCRAKGSII